MTDYARQKYVELMTRIEDLEERAAELERNVEAARAGSDAGEVQLIEQELVSVQRQLAGERSELARLSDGCGRPHPR